MGKKEKKGRRKGNRAISPPRTQNPRNKKESIRKHLFMRNRLAGRGMVPK